MYRVVPVIILYEGMSDIHVCMYLVQNVLSTYPRSRDAARWRPRAPAPQQPFVAASATKENSGQGGVRQTAKQSVCSSPLLSSQ